MMKNVTVCKSEAVENIGGVPDANVDHLGAEGRILIREVCVGHPAGIGAILGIDVTGALGAGRRS